MGTICPCIFKQLLHFKIRLLHVYFHKLTVILAICSFLMMVTMGGVCFSFRQFLPSLALPWGQVMAGVLQPTSPTILPLWPIHACPSSCRSHGTSGPLWAWVILSMAAAMLQMISVQHQLSTKCRLNGFTCQPFYFSHNNRHSRAQFDTNHNQYLPPKNQRVCWSVHQMRMAWYVEYIMPRCLVVSSG